MTRWAAVRVIPELAAVMLSNATRHVALLWNLTTQNKMLKKHLCNNFLTLFYVQCPWNIFLQVALTHRRRINTEEKEKVVAASWGTYLNAALIIKQQGWFEENFWEKIHFGRMPREKFGVMWISYLLKASISPHSCYSIHPFILSSNHPGEKLLVWQRIESILSPKQQRRPLPSPLHLSLSYALTCPHRTFWPRWASNRQCGWRQP